MALELPEAGRRADDLEADVRVLELSQDGIVRAEVPQSGLQNRRAATAADRLGPRPAGLRVGAAVAVEQRRDDP